MKKQYIVAILFLYAGSLLAGGPWPQKKGQVYLKLSEWWLVFDQHYTDQGLLDPNITTGLFNTTIYAEYGFTDRLTGIVYAPLLSRNYMNNLISATNQELLVPGEAINGLGDIDITAKYAISRSFPVSVSLTLGLPTGVPSAGSEGNLQTGDGEFNQLVQIDAGQGFQLSENIGAYFSALVGFNNRTRGFSDEFRYGLEAGMGLLNNRLWLIGRLNGVESFQNGETAATISSTSIFSNNSEFTSYGAEAAYYVTKRFGVSASFASAFRGRIIAAAPSYSVGLFYDMSK
ncbi:hypothetical protein [Portibacter marinus]|uniref:hypothetical protein n=1 Tax=Portibacter marinus TaxID=2898660 RepID=UPI001F314C12|nr:hypothetical protein [Portibacter marinus]